MTNRFAVILAIGAIVFAVSTGIAGAYAVSDSSAQSSLNFNASLPSSSLNLDWNGFWNSLPIQPFWNSLQSAGNATVQNVQNTQTHTFALPTANIANGQGIINQIDDWTQQHFGFRISAVLGIFLGLLSWILGLAKNIVDWLLNLIGGK